LFGVYNSVSVLNYAYFEREVSSEFRTLKCYLCSCVFRPKATNKQNTVSAHIDENTDSRSAFFIL